MFPDALLCATDPVRVVVSHQLLDSSEWQKPVHAYGSH